MDTERKLQAAWLASGRSAAEFERRIARPEALHPHEEYLVERAGIDLPQSCLGACKALIGEQDFDEILSALKASAIEPSAAPVHSPSGVFLHRAGEALSRGNPEAPVRPVRRAR